MKNQLFIKKGDSPYELNALVRDYCSRYPNGVVVTIEPYCMPSTKKQNGLYQVLVRRLAEQSGLSVQEVKAFAKDKAIGKGYPVERDADGDPILEDGRIVPLATKAATIGQMKILIETLYEIGLENGIVLDDVKG